MICSLHSNTNCPQAYPYGILSYQSYNYKLPIFFPDMCANTEKKNTTSTILSLQWLKNYTGIRSFNIK